MKKVLSLVLVIAMVLSSMSFAFGATFTDVADTDYAKAIETLTALGVVTGYEDGTYRPEKVVTRAEMAKLIVEVLGYGDLVAGSKSNFSDTQGHWADAWIALAAGKGLVVGTGDGKFTPDRTVSYDEAITMVVRALGYTDSCNEIKNMTWPTNFKVKAAELKLTKDVKLASTGADRGGVAQLLYNALEAALVTVNSDGDVVKTTVTTTNDKKEVVTKYVLLLSRLAKLDNNVKVTPDSLKKDKKSSYLGDLVDLAPYMYQTIEAYLNDDGYVVYVSDVESEILTGEFRKTVDDDSKVKFEGKVNVRIDGKNKAYTLLDPDATKVYYNGVEVVMTEKEMEVGRADGDTTKTKEIVDLHKAAATFVMDENDKITAIVATKYTDAARVASEYNGKTKLDGYKLPLDDDDKVDNTKLTVKGAVDSLEDIKEDDVIVLFAGAGVVNARVTEPEKLTVEVVRDTVEGKITESNSDGEFLIDGKFYAMSIYAPANLVAVKDEGLFYLDNKGAILAFEVGGTSAVVDYAVVTEIENGAVVEGRQIADPEISLVNVKGEEITYKVKDTAKVDKTKDLLDGLKVINLKENTLVKYSINSKKEITAITTVQVLDPTSTTKVDTTKKGFILANNATVFNYEKDGDVVVVDGSKLGDEVNQIYRVDNKNGQIEVLIVKGLGSSDTYAFITAAGTAANDDDKEVQKLTAYVNGEKRTYYTNEINTVTSSAIDSAKIVKLVLDGDVVEGIEDITAADKLIDEKVVTRVNVSEGRIQIGSVWYTLDDEVAVYVLDGGEFDSVGSISSVYTGAKVSGFAFDEDNQKGNVIEALFVFE